MNRTILSKHIDKKLIDDLKNNTEALDSFLQNQNDGMIIYMLEKMGRLENGFSRKPLLNLLNNSNENIRSLAIKNLAKIGDFSLLSIFIEHACSDESTEVRRESVSAIGRLRSKKASCPIRLVLVSMLANAESVLCCASCGILWGN